MPVHRILLAAALGAVAAPPLAALPATAAPACTNLSGSASADLVRVQVLDPHAFGAVQSPAGRRVAATQATLSATHATATARSLETQTAAPVTTATQQAPPAPSASGNRITSPPVDLGVARVGTGDLRVKAGWPAGSGCGTASSRPAASSSAALADALVLPRAGGGAVLRVPSNLSSGADASLTVRDGHLATTVSARAGLTELRLFEGLGESIQLRVVTAPTLSATAGARSSVRYTSPVIEVHRPNGLTQSLDAPTKTVDIPTAAGVLRLSIGSVSQRITAKAVTAEAATLRVQLLGGGTTLLDLGIGVLQVSASAPVEAAPVAAPAGTLPVTGFDVGWLIGIGLLVAIGGRLLLVVSRRATRAGDERNPPVPAPEAGS
jgi:hypothetical protein